ncbi:contractile injection system tape measure protein [Xenorhabdus sp. XENO-10]|uniref:Contractile injection system tape measure protein n=1 Tax=Xenorhabdus yunnanensis TaxID=3025878 RepID=A0ABT5LJC2_9GAMM|nr:contractile injection system tape measure protein [Xenorhabdus yunnanensis]MDC9591110.1 contractile injection system tape measure protein [Xenorhabdus yunnanensis]
MVVKKNHEITSKKVIDRLYILLNIDKCYSKKIIKNCSEIFKSKIHHLINEEVEKWSIQDDDSVLEKIVLDLGEINLEDFEQQFIYRLEKELKNKSNEFKQNIKNNIDNDLSISEKVKSTSEIPSMPQHNLITLNTLDSEKSVLEGIEHYLKHGIWKSPVLWQQIKNIEFSYWLTEHVNLQPQQWLPMLAKHCLQPAGLSRLIQICQPEVLSMLFQLFIETTTSEFVHSQTQAIIDKKVTPEKLSLAAEHYLRHQIKYINTIQPERGILQNKVNLKPVKNTTKNGNHSLKSDILETNALLNTVQPFSQQTTQTHHQTDNTIPPQLSQSVLSISNAGCMILWPLLPTFFRAFDLLDKNQFISPEAQREAICLLDWLIWGEEEIPAWRLTLNKVICGLSINDNALWRAPEPAKQIAINQWLEKTIVQLPAWKKMGINDVRHLFLQRSGELSELNGITNIHIQPEVYDALISEWPWPMNIANFSWLKHPITITWL